ncbi:MAG: guanylate kinase [Bacteriovoracaceae bacterium]
MKSAKVIVIVAPSGTGKSTIMKRLLETVDALKESISFTTRPIRVGEAHGVDYQFVSEEEFEIRIDEGEFIEWAKVHGNYYGTSQKVVEKSLSEGQNLLCDLDVQGADNIKKAFNENALIIFIAPPTLDELERRLRHRGTDRTDVINLRLLNARSEMERRNDYDHLVINDDLDKAYSEVKAIIEDAIK